MESGRRKPNWVRLYAGLTIFACLGSFASQFFHLSPGPIQPIVGILMIGVGVTVVAQEIKESLALAGVVLLASISELCGLFTGFPFGRYEYTNRWFPTLPLPEGHQFPLLLPFAWLMIVGGCLNVALRFCSGWRAAVLSGAFAACIDIAMERAMTDVFGYWTWLSPGPFGGSPLENVLGWFAVASLASGWIIARRAKIEGEGSPEVLAWFCFFVSFSGLLKGFQFAWIGLLGISAMLLLSRRKKF